VEVVGREREREELHAVDAYCPSEYAAQDLIRLCGRTEKQTALQTTDGGQINDRWIEDTKRSAHEVCPPVGTSSTNRASSPSEVSEGAERRRAKVPERRCQAPSETSRPGQSSGRVWPQAVVGVAVGTASSAPWVIRWSTGASA
jgi:hypothetical protein